MDIASSGGKPLELVQYLKYDSLCRNCNHWFCHEVQARRIAVNRTLSCQCADYIPSDNLEYLEWQYERRHVS